MNYLLYGGSTSSKKLSYHMDSISFVVMAVEDNATRGKILREFSLLVGS